MLNGIKILLTEDIKITPGITNRKGAITKTNINAIFQGID